LKSCNCVFNNISTHMHLCLYQHFPHPTYTACFYFLVFSILSSRWIANPSLFWQPRSNSLSKCAISYFFSNQNMVHFVHFRPQKKTIFTVHIKKNWRSTQCKNSPKKNISVNHSHIPTQNTKFLGSWLPLAWKCFGITISKTTDMQVINELDVTVYYKI
jgi:hypothetical protein